MANELITPHEAAERMLPTFQKIFDILYVDMKPGEFRHFGMCVVRKPKKKMGKNKHK